MKRKAIVSTVNFPRYVTDFHDDSPSQKVLSQDEISFVVQLSMSRSEGEIYNHLQWFQRHHCVRFDLDYDSRRDYKTVTIRCPYTGHFGVFKTTDPVAICVTFCLFFYYTVPNRILGAVNRAWKKDRKPASEVRA